MHVRQGYIAGPVAMVWLSYGSKATNMINICLYQTSMIHTKANLGMAVADIWYQGICNSHDRSVDKQLYDATLVFSFLIGNFWPLYGHIIKS